MIVARLLIFIIVLFALEGCNIFDNKLIWTAINVNSTGKQGDAHIISKGNVHFMIDTGQKYYVNSTLIPYLQTHEIKHLSGVLITHPHFDHYGGMKDLIESGIKIDAIYMNMPTQEQMKKEWWGGHYSDLLDIIKSAKEHNIHLSPVKPGDRYTFDKKAYIDVLYAYDGIHTPVGITDINDMSVIAMLHDGKNKFLFTGDLNKKLGKYLGEHSQDIQADILKFPHHGVEGFAPNLFFQTVNPKVVIVPGPSNLWCSDRSKRARELVKNNHYQSYINGFHGNIRVVSDGETYTIEEEKLSQMICENNEDI